MWFIRALLCLWLLDAPAHAQPPRGDHEIDRKALVQRHSPTVTTIDPAAPFMVGNGQLALSADITGLSLPRAVCAALSAPPSRRSGPGTAFPIRAFV
jgi:hypothetical protein